MNSRWRRAAASVQRLPTGLIGAFVAVAVVNLLATAVRNETGVFAWFEWVFWSLYLLFAVTVLVVRRRANRRR